MEKLPLHSYGVSELTYDEQRQIEGGWLACLLGAIFLCGMCILGLLSDNN